MGFTNTGDELYGIPVDLLIWVIVATFVCVLLIIFALLWRRVVSGRVERQAPVKGLHYGDLTSMRKAGLISEEEYLAIKRKVAERTLAESRERKRSERDLSILRAAEVDPDAVRQLLPEELVDEEPAPASRKPTSSSNPTQPESPEPIDPLGGVAPPKPSMNMPRVVREKNRVAAAEPSELDALFEKGVITPDQYRKLKGFFKKDTPPS